MGIRDSNDRIHRRPDVVAHAGKEFSLCRIRRFRTIICFLHRLDVYKRQPIIRFSIVARSLALIVRAYSFVLSISSAK